MVKRLYKYDVGDEVIVNEKCKWGYPNLKEYKGIVHRRLDDSVLYDYEVEFTRSSLKRFKEEELDYPAPYKEEIR